VGSEGWIFRVEIKKKPQSNWGQKNYGGAERIYIQNSPRSQIRQQLFSIIFQGLNSQIFCKIAHKKRVIWGTFFGVSQIKERKRTTPPPNALKPFSPWHIEV